MHMDDKVLKELSELREKLRRNTPTESGRTATICTDRALESIARNMPRTLDEMRVLDSVSKEFVDKYGEQFLAVVKKNIVSNDRSLASHRMTEHQVSVLKELEKNLVDINRRNKLLYLAKSQPKYAQDLYSMEYDIRDLIFGKKRILTICTRTPTDTKRYTAFSSVIREVNRGIREKGRNDLYIGYPFVKGRLPGEGFEVRAPLALIPVKADRTPDRISISLDSDRETLFNNILILAYHKHNNIRKPLPEPEFEEYRREDFLTQIVNHYREQGINIPDVSGEPVMKTFTDYKSGEFPKYGVGELEFENVSVLGKFTVRTSSIHGDYEQMLENNELNGLLDTLIDAYDTETYDDTFCGDTEIKDKKKKESISEKDMVYINDLNGSQEAVLKAIGNTDGIVIQGPPGTGKSQTIASLIVDSVNKGKTVLMVSEKKTALDVVYSRLGILSKYAVQIDDIGDKESFYRQMDELINMRPTQQQDVNIDSVSIQIDSEIERLESISRTMFTPGEFGIEPYQMFHCCDKIPVYDNRQYDVYKMLPQFGNMTSMKYSDLKGSYDMFCNTHAADDLCTYISYTKECPVLPAFDRGLGDFDLRMMSDETVRIDDDIQKWKNSFFLKRIFGKGSVNREVRSFVDRYLPHGDGKAITSELITDGFSDIRYGIDNYSEFVRTNTIYENINDSQKEYLDALSAVRGLYPDGNTANSLLYTQLIGWHIEEFKKNNLRVFNTIDDFNNIVTKIRNLTSEKKKLSVKHTDCLLYGNLSTYMNDPEKKGCKELRRKVESKRKKSVNAFVKMFTAQLFNGIKIWLMTPEVVSEIIPLEKGRFDLLIFDEASQMYREKGIPAIYRAKKVVIAGDDKQLRPSSIGKGRFDPTSEDEDDDQDAAVEETSLLDLAKAKYTPVLLDYHYRSKYEELINFSNYAFYRARLYVSPNVAEPEEPPIKMHIVNGVWADRTNMEEAKTVVKLIREFFEKRQNNETIGVITFNINQRDLIERLLEEECQKDPAFDARYDTECARRENGEDVGLFIRSIENVQGDERDVIIFSIGYAKDSDGRFRRFFGMLSQEGGENRLNVAITRAKKKIQIVTSMNPSDFDVSGISSKGPFFLRKYLEYSYAISNRDRESALRILHSFHDEQSPSESVRFDSEFEEQVYDALKERGLDVYTQIGVGGYSIDLAVRKNGKYILGIECDGKLYHSSDSARERDYHRQKYLESRGWKIYRIWSTNWWNDKDKEADKIVSVVKSLA